MRKRSEFSGLVRVFRLLGGFCFLIKVWALIVILIACLPPRQDWQMYCLALYVPLLLISLSLSIWWAFSCGTDFAYRSKEDEKSQGHE